MAAVLAHNADQITPEGICTSIAFQSIRERHDHDRSEEGTDYCAVVSACGQQPLSWKEKPPTNAQRSRMPGTTGSGPLLASLPSFMSVFGNGVDVQEASELDNTTSVTANRIANTLKRPSHNSHHSSPVLRRDSTSTFESTDSSPTTTISTMDSLTEPSPSSSPESPTSILPLSSLSTSFRSDKQTGTGAPESLQRASSAFASLPGLNRGDSPNKKMRNMKNLSVNTSASSRASHQISSLTFQPGTSTTAKAHAFSAPPTPAFIVPPKPPKKRPSNLGLKLTTPDSSIGNQDTQSGSSIVPPTPSIDSQSRTLNYLQSVSTVPMISSPTVAPEGGMKLPPFGGTSTNFRPGRSRPPLSTTYHSSENNHSSPITRQTLDHVEEENDYELPLSREVKSPAYPQGPVCIYDPHVYLYLEPTDSEASKFDVVLNVAREVKNPFLAAAGEMNERRTEDAAVQVSLTNGNLHDIDREALQEPQTAISDKSFSSAFESQPADPPKEASNPVKAERATPEYIHILWDHNTNVVDDLLRLCELIDDRAQQGKKVLIHCQCGVSRSASLVVAYGLYKNPQLTVQEAYDAVKSRSKWIGPNMNLIYQLSEFKSKLPKAFLAGPPNWHSWRMMGSGRANPHSTPLNIPASLLQDPSQGPVSGPFRKDLDLTPARANSFSPPSSANIEGRNQGGDVSPGPSSAPPDMQWSPSDTIVPSDSIMTNIDAQERSPEILMSPEAEEFAVSPTDASSHKPQDNTELEPSGKTQEEPAAELGPSTSEPSQAPSPLTPSLPAGFSSLASRRAAAPTQLPFRQASAPRFSPAQVTAYFRPEASMNNDEPPPTPSLLSPRAAEFTASPFHRTAAGDLAGSSVFEQALMSPKAVQDKEEDPRSPATRGEAPITRSIFDVL
ncbi:MAG: hypothetical protein HETSPECPRED_008783 [Heterodermia speciosa]|uniref:protein-tyrosine-phosphatase n=1 Tax=Heterodermia speciosa TaxID=116794 RepID=A0A8H3I8J2_9LECA|nr:MAG: hypothetical protein HETSPECPRED_008783 [Heterodermia speciosa]